MKYFTKVHTAHSWVEREVEARSLSDAARQAVEQALQKEEIPNARFIQHVDVGDPNADTVERFPWRYVALN